MCCIQSQDLCFYLDNKWRCINHASLGYDYLQERRNQLVNMSKSNMSKKVLKLQELVFKVKCYRSITDTKMYLAYQDIVELNETLHLK